MGCSPYYAATGTHPLIPFDITEATYLQPPPDSILSTTDLLIHCVIALQQQPGDLAKLRTKVFAARKQAAILFERKHVRMIHDYKFAPGSLVLMRNTQIEYKLNQKIKPQYLGPLIIVSRNRGGAYIVAELDGSVFDRPVAAFRLIPYFARAAIPIPKDLLDVNQQRIRKMELSNYAGDLEAVAEDSEDKREDQDN
jgi:hypothetical protein